MAFSRIPDEIVQHILHHVDPEHVLFVTSRLSRRFGRLSNEPRLWRYFCEVSFTHWHPCHEIAKKLKNRLLETDWRALFALRLRRNRQAEATFNSIITSSVNRHQNEASLAQLGYDVKDFLLAQSRAPDDLDDFLARR